MKLFTKKIIRLSDAIQSSIHADTQKVILNFKDIEVLDTVSVVYHNCETLYLSQNKIKNLHCLYQFKRLKNLSLSYNLIDDFAQLNCIKSPELVSLSLQGNPIALHPNYRFIVLEKFPKLRSLDSKIVTRAERLNLDAISELKMLYLRVLFTVDHLCVQLYRDNSRYLIKMELYRRAYGSHNVFNRNEPPAEPSVLERKSKWKRCLKIIDVPTLDKSERTKWTTCKLIQAIKDMFDYNQMSSAIETVMNGIGSEQDNVLQTFGRSIMNKIKVLYENQQGFPKAQFLQQEKSFAIFASDPVFLDVMFQIVIDKCKELQCLENQRETIAQSNLYALSVPGLRMVAKSTASSRDDPKAVWSQLERNVRFSQQLDRHPKREPAICPGRIHVHHTSTKDKKTPQKKKVNASYYSSDDKEEDTRMKPKLFHKRNRSDNRDITVPKKSSRDLAELVAMASLHYEQNLLGKCFNAIRSVYRYNMKRKILERNREEQKERTANAHYYAVLLQKVLVNWREVAHLRSQCRKAIRKIRHVQKQVLISRCFNSLKEWTRLKKLGRSQEKRPSSRSRRHEEHRTYEDKFKLEPDEVHKKSTTKKKTLMDRVDREKLVEYLKERKKRKKSAERENRRSKSISRREKLHVDSGDKSDKHKNLVMISATKVREDSVSPEFIRALQKNIQDQRAWLKKMKQQESVKTR